MAAIRALALLALTLATPVAARQSLGMFDGWGAFRDERPAHCFAIAEPARHGSGKWRPFAGVATWPDSGVRGQVHFRVSREVQPGAPATLVIGARRFAMIASGPDVWAPDARSDASIVAALRSAPSMRIEARAANGGTFAESYALKGAATAIDAAALGCVRR